MSNLERLPGETSFQHHKRLIYGKLVDHTMSDVDYVQLAKSVYGVQYSSDVARRMMYGSCKTLQMLDRCADGDMVANRILALSDFHVPFNLPIDVFQRYAGKVDTLVLNGDIQDCQSISKFTKSYRIDMVDEMVATRKLILDLAYLIKPKRIYITVGNHQKRLGRVLSNTVGPQIMGIMPDTPLDLIVKDGFRKRDRMNGTDAWYGPIDELLETKGIQVHFDGQWWCKVGHTIFAHPIAYSGGMLKTTQKAVNYFLRVDRDFDTIVLGHTHKLGSYFQGGIAMYEQGCCCDLERLDYGDAKLMIPNQSGFLYMCQDSDGKVVQDRTKLIHI